MASDSAGIPIEEKLRQFIIQSASRKFSWTGCNCGFWVCDWIAKINDIDPVAQYRGRFKTSLGFKRFIAKAGGNEGFSRMVARNAGLLETNAPKLGYVGLVNGSGATMAIKASGWDWIVKTEDGIAIAPFQMIAAWEV